MAQPRRSHCLCRHPPQWGPPGRAHSQSVELPVCGVCGRLVGESSAPVRSTPKDPRPTHPRSGPGVRCAIGPSQPTWSMVLGQARRPLPGRVGTATSTPPGHEATCASSSPLPAWSREPAPGAQQGPEAVPSWGLYCGRVLPPGLLPPEPLQRGRVPGTPREAAGVTAPAGGPSRPGPHLATTPISAGPGCWPAPRQCPCLPGRGERQALPRPPT